MFTFASNNKIIMAKLIIIMIVLLYLSFDDATLMRSPWVRMRMERGGGGRPELRGILPAQPWPAGK